MATIWLNHWFSTAYNIVKLIKESNPNHRVICSNANEFSPIKAACDEWFIVPVLHENEYVDFCLDFCFNHQIEVFMPRRHMVAVSQRKNEFEARGIRVMVDDYEAVKVLNDKVCAYSEFKKRGLGIVPDYRLVTTANEFASAYNELKECYDSVCFKFVRDEGGKSYRRIDNKAKGYETLFKRKTTRITYEDALAFLSERESFAPIMVMPYLPDEEISVDCLCIAGKVIAIPRIKTESRVEEIRYDDEIIATCDAIVKSFNLQQPCNIQFKLLHGTPYLLEVNTRMSGGTHMSCLAAGVNIPGLAVEKLLGSEVYPDHERRECFVSQVEVPVLL